MCQSFHYGIYYTHHFLYSAIFSGVLCINQIQDFLHCHYLAYNYTFCINVFTLEHQMLISLKVFSCVVLLRSQLWYIFISFLAWVSLWYCKNIHYCTEYCIEKLFCKINIKSLGTFSKMFSSVIVNDLLYRYILLFCKIILFSAYVVT